MDGNDNNCEHDQLNAAVCSLRSGSAFSEDIDKAPRYMFFCLKGDICFCTRERTAIHSLITGKGAARLFDVCYV